MTQHDVESILLTSTSLCRRSEVAISANRVRASMTAWNNRKLSPSLATKQADGEFDRFPSVVLWKNIGVFNVFGVPFRQLRIKHFTIAFHSRLKPVLVQAVGSTKTRPTPSQTLKNNTAILLPNCMKQGDCKGTIYSPILGPFSNL